jgi:hypothetical protein
MLLLLMSDDADSIIVDHRLTSDDNFCLSLLLTRILACGLIEFGR